MLIFTAVVQILAVLDAVCEHWAHLLNLIYVPLLMYKIVKLMDTKQAKLANSFFPMIAAILTIVGLYLHLVAFIVANKEKTVQ